MWHQKKYLHPSKNCTVPCCTDVKVSLHTFAKICGSHRAHVKAPLCEKIALVWTVTLKHNLNRRSSDLFNSYVIMLSYGYSTSRYDLILYSAERGTVLYNSIKSWRGTGREHEKVTLRFFSIPHQLLTIWHRQEKMTPSARSLAPAQSLNVTDSQLHRRGSVTKCSGLAINQLCALPSMAAWASL